MFLTGLTASCAAWTKNEGMLFLGLVIIVHFFSDFRMEDWRRTLKESTIFLLALYFLVSGFEKNYLIQTQFLSKVALLLLLLGGYFFSFLISPNSLDWHLNSAFDRLLIHTWPSWVFLFFYCVKGPEKFTVAGTHRCSFKSEIK